MIVKNSQLNPEAIDALNKLVELDIKAPAAFKLTRIFKDISSIVEDKLKVERKILDKWAERDESGNIKQPLDVDGVPIKGAVNITNMSEFTKEMNALMDVENIINHEKVNFEEMDLQTAKIKDLIKLDFIFN